MSKTFDASSTTQAVAAYWKRSAESAIAWLNKYRDDPFFRTEVNVILLQAIFACIVLGIVFTSYTFNERGLEVILNDAFTAIHANGLIAQQATARVDLLRQQDLEGVVGIIILTTVIFGYIIGRVALAPSRNALKSQKQFIGNIAHELRTPLSVIKTDIEVALLEGHLQRETKATMESTIEELDRISEIINNLLSFSALVKPERMEFSTVDLSKLADETVQKFGRLAQRNDQQVTLRKSPDCLVWGNPTALSQVVGNVLKNALNYTPRGGHVRVTVEQGVNNQVELVVQDSGVGIARQDLFRIFEPFYRADPSRTRGSGGSGLGLTIVSELVKVHHGKIAIRSAIRRGTTVSVLFPGISGHGIVGTEVEKRETLNEIAVDFSQGGA